MIFIYQSIQFPKQFPKPNNFPLYTRLPTSHIAYIAMIDSVLIVYIDIVLPVQEKARIYGANLTWWP